MHEPVCAREGIMGRGSTQQLHMIPAGSIPRLRVRSSSNTVSAREKLIDDI